MVSAHPEYYHAYFGISQFINKQEGMRISQSWLREQATKKNDTITLAKLDSLQNLSFFKGEHDRFVHQYVLVNQYGGALHNLDALPEIEKAQSFYEDYKEYDWVGAWQTSAQFLQKEFYSSDVREIKELKIPVVLFEGRYDWNVPAVLAQTWLDNLKAPQKQIIWFENSAHGPLEKEPKAFNKAILEQLK